METKLKMYCWSYILVSREVDSLPRDTIMGRMAMPTECGVTVAIKLSQDYETHYVDYLQNLGEIEIMEKI